jgi:hypothetical protein
MAYPTAIHQIIDYLSWGDATSNHARLLRDVLGSRGIRSEIYARGCDPHVASHCRPPRECRPGQEDWLIYQYSLGSPLTEFALAHAERTILSYHNITSPHFFTAFDPRFAVRLECAIHDLQRMKGLVGAVSVSHYNCRYLEELGFSPVTHIPLLFSLDELGASATSPGGRCLYKQLDDGRHNILQAYLDMLVESLDLIDSVTFAGRVPLVEGFGAFYPSADVFLCLSEHEGFGVPLVESMYLSSELAENR